jgi:hypothetical protein
LLDFVIAPSLNGALANRRHHCKLEPNSCFLVVDKLNFFHVT